MRKASRILTLFLALAVLLTLTACGGSKEPASSGGADSSSNVSSASSEEVPVASDAGYYIVASWTNGEETLDAEGVKSRFGEVYMVLNEGGTGYLFDESIGGKQDITWEPGKITCEGDPASYTRDGDMITMELNEITATFTRSNEQPPALDAGSGDSSASEAAPAASDAGYYVLTSMSNGEETLTAEDVQSKAGKTLYIVLNEDGTGYGNNINSDEIDDLTWEPGKIVWDENYSYSMNGNEMTVKGPDGITFVLTRSSETPPAK